MTKTSSNGGDPTEAGDRPPPEPALADATRQLCSALADIGGKLDRLEDAVHDLTSVLARAVGPPWDVLDE
jgi:hypothetical protein